MQHVFETPGTVRLKISIAAGDVHIETADRSTTEVELHALNRAAEEAIGELTVRCDEQVGVWTVVVEEPKRGFLSSLFDKAEIGVRVRCPRDVDVDLQTGSADVRVLGDVSSAIAKSGSGDLEFDDVRGGLEASSASGDVSVEKVGGDCAVKTASGDIRVMSVAGELVANLVSGDLEVERAEGPVTAQSVSGDQRIAEITAGDVRLQSVSGDIYVGVRPGLRLYIDATSVSGDMSSSLDAADGPPADGPLVELRAKTVSGDVQIARAA
jgi:DUF4097 and DUF4098 domain-containing protein YvlB